MFQEFQPREGVRTTPLSNETVANGNTMTRMQNSISDSMDFVPLDLSRHPMGEYEYYDEIISRDLIGWKTWKTETVFSLR